MAITQVITTLPDAPDPATDTRDQFSTKAAASVLAQKAMVPELNAWAAEVNAIAATAVGDVATAIGAAAADTPVGTDEFAWRKVATGILKKVTFTNALAWFAAAAGDATKVFSVAAATDAAHAVRYDQTFGLGQTWADYLATRAFDTIYTNTTSKPITVNVFATGAANAVLTATSQGIVLYGSAMGAGSVTNSIMFIVVPGAGYIVNQSVTAGQTLYAWSELR